MKNKIRITSNEITLRPVLSSDLMKMRSWRNSDWARSFFLNSEIISPEQQEKWYQSYINKTDDYMFIIELDNIDVGTVALYHVNHDEGSAEFGRLLIAEKEARGRSIGEKVLRILSEFAFNDFKLSKITLEVFSDNDKAVYIYQKVGFTVYDKYFSENREVLKMVLFGGQDGEN